MNRSPLSTRIVVLIALLSVEIAMVVSLRTSGWNATGGYIRSVMIVVATVLPAAMTAVLLYRRRGRLRPGQASLREFMAVVLVVASYLALLPLFYRSNEPNMGPLSISKSVRFEVFKVASAAGTNRPTFTDPDTGAVLHALNPAVLTSADVATVQLEEDVGLSLSFVLTPTGANKLLKATQVAPGARLVAVVDGQVISAPKIIQPIWGGRFQMSGGKIHADGYELFRVMTSE